MKKHTKKGFTLIEMIVVIAVISVLMGIGLLAWSNYLKNARLKAANNKAKVIFNAAQTEITDMKFSERSKKSTPMKLMKYGSSGAQYTGENVAAYPYLRDGTFYYYYNGTTGFICDETGTAFTGTEANPGGDISKTATAAQKAAIIADGNSKLMTAVNKVLNDEETVYKIYVKDYNVESVVVGRYDGDKYVGRYPDPTVDTKTNSDIDLSGEALESIRLLSQNAMEHIGKK